MVDFRVLPRAETIRLFEQWADEAEDRAAEFQIRWQEVSSTQGGGTSDFEDLLRWVTTQMRWHPAVPDSDALPLWLRPGNEHPPHTSGLADHALVHPDVESARLLDQFCAYAVVSLGASVPGAHLFMYDQPGHLLYRRWALRANLAFWGVLSPAKFLIARRCWDLMPPGERGYDVVDRLSRNYREFGEDAERTADGRWRDGPRMTRREKLAHGLLLHVERVDAETLRLVMRPELLAYEDEVAQFIEALATVRTHESVRLTETGTVHVISPKQTRTHLDAWALKWWRPRLPQEVRERMPDADLTSLGSGLWSVGFDDDVAHRSSKKIDQFVERLNSAADAMHADRIDREYVELRVDPGFDLIPVVESCWAATFGSKKTLQVREAE